MTTKASAKPEEKKPAPAPAKPAPAPAKPAPAPAKASPKPAAKAAAKPVAEKAADPKPAAPEKAAKPEKPQKPKASKVIRDSFTFPETDYQLISELKKSCLGLGINAKKSEILRAGLHALAALDKNKLKDVISKIEKIKTGRPLGSEKS